MFEVMTLCRSQKDKCDAGDDVRNVDNSIDEDNTFDD